MSDKTTVSDWDERADWPEKERLRLKFALQEARLWQYLEPHRFDFWEIFDAKLLVDYPACRFQTGQVRGGDVGRDDS